MLNEGTSIQAGFSVSVGLMEGMHESPIQSPYGLKTLLCVTGAIVQSPFACQNMYYTCWNGDTEPFSFLEMLNVLLHVQPRSWNPYPLLKGSLPYRKLSLRIFAKWGKLCAPFRSVAFVHLKCYTWNWNSKNVGSSPKEKSELCPQNTWQCKTSWYFFLFYLTRFLFNLLLNT